MGIKGVEKDLADKLKSDTMNRETATHILDLLEDVPQEKIERFYQKMVMVYCNGFRKGKEYKDKN